MVRTLVRVRGRVVVSISRFKIQKFCLGSRLDSKFTANS